ncbi:hypothetical protein GJ744_000082 [Endocarpon pusillum]|uniref:AAA+ ATPase domain-containing protein n=1 Tax=Endocarpon pusillum TaxID=364733 RepID=A0A8H7AWS1_9EURO|nr:hypothetical protein GJ744_000082 [Endocarpon pusillum]
MSVLDTELFRFDFQDFNDKRAEGLNCQLIKYDSKVNSQGNRVRLEVERNANKLEYEDEDDFRGDDPALVLTRYFSRTGIILHSELQIRSIHMQNALRKCIAEYPEIQFHTNPIVMNNSPRYLFFYLEELGAYGRTLDDPVASCHIMYLLRYMEHCFHSAMRTYRNFVKVTTSMAALDWQNLWMVFRPGTLVYREAVSGSPLLSKVEAINICECSNPLHAHNFWTIKVANVDFTGRHYEWSTTKLELKSFDGFRRLNVLPVFPLDYHPDKDRIFQRLVERGKKFLDFSDVHYKQYDGVTRVLANPFRFSSSSITISNTKKLKGRFIIDRKGFADVGASRRRDDDDDDDDNDGEGYHRVSVSKTIKCDDNGKPQLSENDLAACAHEVPGFSLTLKCWFHLDVEDISETIFNEDAFDSLLMSEKQKKMLEALITTHRTNVKGDFDDVIAGKGKGLILLLHGVPGVGKTLTAEGIADLSKRPLYTISSGDLGMTADVVEHNLSKAFTRAESWNAIVLMDEADVFLTRRSPQNLERGALVSIFLRMIEYYEGVMILTTNRMNTINSAFLSRVHLAVQYNEHSADTRQTLWRNFIRRASAGAIPPWLNDDAIKKLASYPLNGRQIRNSLRIAHALAGSTGRALSFENVDAAASATLSFNQDIDTEIGNHGKDSDEDTDNVRNQSEAKEADDGGAGGIRGSRKRRRTRF